MENQICYHYKYGFCKIQDNCQKRHVQGECNAASGCKVKVCDKRHPRVCKKFSLEQFCKFGDECAYRHPLDTSDQFQKLCLRNEKEIIKLKEEVSELKLEIKQLTSLKHLVQKSKDVTTGTKVTKDDNFTKEKIFPSVSVKSKFKCDKCDCSFKKEIPLRKHKNTKHAKANNSERKELAKGKFGPIVCNLPEKEINLEALETKEINSDISKEYGCDKEDHKEGEGQKEQEEKGEIKVQFEKKEDKAGNTSTSDSKDDETFLSKFDNDGNFIG